MTEPSILDARLAEIDRRLSTLQTDLGPARLAPDPAVELPPPTPLYPEAVAPVDDDEPDRLDLLLAQLSGLSDAHERLLELHRDLLGEYAALLEQGASASRPATLALDAGPFTDGRSVRAFESAVAGLPGVAAVEVREYAGSDRVVLEVRLDPDR